MKSDDPLEAVDRHFFVSRETMGEIYGADTAVVIENNDSWVDQV